MLNALFFSSFLNIVGERLSVGRHGKIHVCRRLTDLTKCKCFSVLKQFLWSQSFPSMVHSSRPHVCKANSAIYWEELNLLLIWSIQAEKNKSSLVIFWYKLQSQNLLNLLNNIFPEKDSCSSETFTTSLDNKSACGLFGISLQGQHLFLICYLFSLYIFCSFTTSSTS